MEFLKFFSEWLDISVILLLLLLALAIYIIRDATRNPDSYWKTVFDDDSGKRSALRIGVLIALSVSSAILIYISANLVKTGADLDALFKFYTVYIAVWSGAKVVEKLIDLLVAKFAK